MKKFEKAQIDLNGIKQPVFKLAIDLTISAEARIMSYANSEYLMLKKNTKTDNFNSISLKDDLIEYRVNQQGSVQQKQVTQQHQTKVEQEQQ